MQPLKKKSLVASIATLAMAIGGLGIGAGVANAAEPAAGDITLTNAQAGHTYDFYKIGNYAGVTAGVKADADADPVVEGVDGSLAVVKASDEANTAVHNAAAGADGTATDSVTWASSLPTGSAQLRKLVSDIDVSGLGAAVASKTATSTEDITVNLPEGWYLVKDTYLNKTVDPDGVKTEGVGALVGTVASVKDAEGNATVVTKLINKDGETLFTLGSVDVKPDDTKNPGTPDPDAKKTFKGSLAKGSQNGQDKADEASKPEFTLTANGPTFSPTIEYKSYDYQFIDTPTGLDIDTATLKVKVADALDGTTDENGYLKAAEYKVTKDDTTGVVTIDLSTYFTALATSAKDASSLSGKLITVTYQAEVTGATSADVSNKFDINDNGHEVPGGPGTEVTPDDGVADVSFKKIGVGDQAKALANAEFQLVDPDTDAVLATATSGDDGVVDFKSVADGTYKLVESKAPTGYTKDIPGLGGLTVTVDTKDTEDKSDDTVTFADSTNTGMLTVNGSTVNATGENATLLNVQNLAQLPLTGAYGIALFAILAVVLAGGAVVMVQVSKRNQKAGLAL